MHINDLWVVAAPSYVRGTLASRRFHGCCLRSTALSLTFFGFLGASRRCSGRRESAHTDGERKAGEAISWPPPPVVSVHARASTRAPPCKFR